MTPLPALRAARIAAGLTTATVGQMIGKTQSHYSKIERGAVRLSATDAAKLCTIWGLAIADLVKN